MHISRASPSLKSGSLKTKQSIFKQELPYGLHTITIEWAEANRQTKNNKEQPSLFINVDSFRVTGQPVAVPPKEAVVRFEETNAFVQFKGIWKTNVSVLNSGGTVKYSGVQGNYAQFNFTGKKVELVANTDVNGGKANVYVDGKLATAELSISIAQASGMGSPYSNPQTLPAGIIPYESRISV
ncbi:hypothetical protein [Paenibacillus tianjinensis]|uniref:DUF4397 domain-containing protein n=1 Tax=Paenibacillus tianjinensis TaxID=2810347 RepID=A0ABX7LDI4_9BACL|nr:hypothetical protein [Paenibacillus tianjinensis]QSF46185.1 hypothetical protein JRJ22_06125 [Paenibacillus tianjinensis]